MAATEVLIVITPEPTSLTDAYALLKVLLANGFKGKARIVVNQCRDVNQAKKIFQKFNEAVISHLKAATNLTGVLVSDPNITASVKEQKAFIDLYPGSKATKCVVHLARTLLSNVPEENFNHDLAPFWEQCFNIIKSPLSIKGVRKKTEDQDSHNKDDLSTGSQEAKHAEPAPSMDEVKSNRPSLSTTDIDSSCRDAVKDIHSLPGKSGHDEIPDLVRELIYSVKTVSDELRNMRDSMGKLQPGGAKMTVSGPAIDLVRNNNMFILDYEAFQKKHHG
jgi:hypothetical protein